MKWGELSAFRKVVFVIWILCLIAGVALTILDAAGILPGIDTLDDLIDCVFWLCAGVMYWNQGAFFPIICLIVSGLNLICVFL